MATKQETARQFDALQTFINGAPDGVGIEQIVDQLGLDLDRRTLQRRLETLLKDRRIARTGKSSNTRYRSTAVDLRHADSQPGPFVPASKSGAKIQAYLKKPVQARKIVGYVRAFLDSYQPNVSAYLSAAEKTHLMAIGKPSLAAQAAGTFAKHVLGRLLIDLSWNSSRLEGNTYSLLDTKRLVDFGQEADGKDRREAQMILNHKAAIEFLVHSASEINFDRLTTCNLHALLADGLLEDPDSPGRLRQILVGIDGSTYHPPGVPQMIAECFDQILATAAAITDPFEQALFVMVQLPYLQPFDDVNKRVSRLAANIPLFRSNLYPLSFIDVPKET